MRTFLAADIEPGINKKVNEVIDRLSRIDGGVKWVRPENHHITVYFFGEIDEATRASIEGIAAGVLEGVSPFPVRVEGISAFPHVNRPRVIWIGVENFGGELRSITEKLKREFVTRRLSVPIEDRDYTPHLTIGRVKERCSPSLSDEMAAVRMLSFGQFEIRSFILYESVLRREGPLYTPLRDFALA